MILKLLKKFIRLETTNKFKILPMVYKCLRQITIFNGFAIATLHINIYKFPSLSMFGYKVSPAHPFGTCREVQLNVPLRTA